MQRVGCSKISAAICSVGRAYDANGNFLAENRTACIHDAAGNLTGVEEDGLPTESYTHNAGNEITNAGFSYDANGNLTADGTFTYLYDAQCQLREVTTSGTPICSMTYDYAGRRTSLTTPSGTTYFHWASGLLAAESDGTGAVTATYAYSPEGGLLSMTRGGETYYYQTNGKECATSRRSRTRPRGCGCAGSG